MSSSAQNKHPPPSSIHSPATRFILLAVLLSGADFITVASCSGLLNLRFMRMGVVLGPVLSTYSLLSALMVFLCLMTLRPAGGFLSLHRQKKVISDKQKDRAFTAISRLPNRLVFFKIFQWSVIAVVTALSSSRVRSVSLAESLAAASMVLSAGACMSILWRFVIHVFMGSTRRVILEIKGERVPYPGFTSNTLDNLFWSGLLCSAVGVVVLALFIVKFLSFQRRALLLTITYAPITVAILVATWAWAVKRLSRPLLEHEKRKTGDNDSSVVQAFKAAQTLPYIFSLIQTSAWVLGGILLTVKGIWLFGMDIENASILFAAVIITSLAVLLYQALWHRRLMRPFLQHLGKEFELPIERIRSPLSVRVKMLVGFGILTFFACATAIFWSFIQYRNLATDFIEKQAELRLELLEERLHTLDRIQQGVRNRDVIGILRENSATTEGVYYYLARTGRVFVFSGLQEPPPLPLEARTRMRQEEKGFLNLSRENLTGAFAGIKLKSGHHGSVAILYPGYRGRDPGLARHIKMLIVFFGLLLSVTAGVVVLIVDDLTGPLKGLERRVEQMARGDLQRPIPAGLEVDEVGMLAVAFESMRRSLDEKLSKIGALNLDLERKVKERTQDLARANDDLRQTLQTLTKTQEQLLRSEKLASLGQLVAGITHEINNPINAVINCLKPLETAVGEFLESLEPDAPDFKQAKQLTQEIHQIIRVIRSGTNRTKRIVSALGDYSRTDVEEKSLVDIHTVLSNSLEITAHLTGDIEIQKDLNEPGPVEGWSGQLEQVFVNLIANAAQALVGRDKGPCRNKLVNSGRQGAPPARTEEQGNLNDSERRETQSTGMDRRSERSSYSCTGPKGVITLKTQLRRNKTDQEGVEVYEVVVHVCDNGPGIPNELRAKIFDPFFTTKDVGAGTGLGLSISHDIITRHGGKIEVTGKIGEGTCFAVYLPKAPTSE